MKRIVVLSDMQIPHHDRKAVEALRGFLYEYDLDELLCVGDEADSPEVSRWNKSMAGEYAGTLQKNLDLTYEVMSGFRKAIGDKPFRVQRSNHTDRIQTYVRRYAPALESLRDLHYQKLVRYDELEIDFRHRIGPIAPGWVMAHGDEGSLIQSAGGTALSLARRIGRSVVCGHTHRAGVQHWNEGVAGRITRSLTGMEVGHLMDLKQADYLKTGAANWQQAFGLLFVSGSSVHQVLVPIVGRSFVVEGRVYSW